MTIAIEPKFICDIKGKPVEVVLSIENYLNLLDKLEDQEDVRIAKEALATSSSFIGLEEFLRELKAEGRL